MNGNGIQTNDTIAVRRLATEQDLDAAIEREALLTMGMDRGLAHSVWATSDNTAVAVVYADDGDADGDGNEDEDGNRGGWMVVVRGPLRSAITDEDGDGDPAHEDGPGESLVHLAEVVRAEVGGVIKGLTVPRSAHLRSALERWQIETGADWDLMACVTPPPLQPGESNVRTDLTEAEVQGFLDRVNPHHSVRADDPTVELWAGVRDDQGAVLAVGALTRRRTGTGYLGSIATDPAARGTGYGSAVTAFLTRQVFVAGGSACTLAHYHPNDIARRVYLRLGYRTIAQNHSAHFG